MFRKNWIVIALVTMVMCIVVLTLNFGAIGQESKSDDSKKRVNELLQERLTVLDQIAKLQRKLYEQGEASIDSVLTAETEVLVGKLELATTRDERIAIRESLVEISRQLEAIAKKTVEAAEGAQSDVLKAKALRLRSEADLIRERATN